MPFESTDEELRLSELDPKDKVLLLSIPSDTFRGFSYINPNAIIMF